MGRRAKFGIFLTIGLSCIGLAQQPTIREYIRLGGRVIAIETVPPDAAVEATADGPGAADRGDYLWFNTALSTNDSSAGYQTAASLECRPA